MVDARIKIRAYLDYDKQSAEMCIQNIPQYFIRITDLLANIRERERQVDTSLKPYLYITLMLNITVISKLKSD